MVWTSVASGRMRSGREASWQEQSCQHACAFVLGAACHRVAVVLGVVAKVEVELVVVVV